MARIFLLLNDPVAAARLRALIDATTAHRTVGWVATLEQAREQIAQARPELVIADLLLADGPFASLLDALCHSPRYGRPRSLVLTPSADHPHLMAALRHGADSFALHTRPAEARLAAVEQVLRGEALIAPPIAKSLRAHFGIEAAGPVSMADAQNPLTLSGIERRVLDATAEGYADGDIERALCIDARELGQRVRAIYRKLQFDLHAGDLTLQAA